MLTFKCFYGIFRSLFFSLFTFFLLYLETPSPSHLEKILDSGVIDYAAASLIACGYGLEDYAELITERELREEVVSILSSHLDGKNNGNDADAIYAVIDGLLVDWMKQSINIPVVAEILPASPLASRLEEEEEQSSNGAENDFSYDRSWRDEFIEAAPRKQIDIRECTEEEVLILKKSLLEFEFEAPSSFTAIFSVFPLLQNFYNTVVFTFYTPALQNQSNRNPLKKHAFRKVFKGKVPISAFAIHQIVLKATLTVLRTFTNEVPLEKSIEMILKAPEFESSIKACVCESLGLENTDDYNFSSFYDSVAPEISTKAAVLAKTLSLAFNMISKEVTEDEDTSVSWRQKVFTYVCTTADMVLLSLQGISLVDIASKGSVLSDSTYQKELKSFNDPLEVQSKASMSTVSAFVGRKMKRSFLQKLKSLPREHYSVFRSLATITFTTFMMYLESALSLMMSSPTTSSHRTHLIGNICTGNRKLDGEAFFALYSPLFLRFLQTDVLAELQKNTLHVDNFLDKEFLLAATGILKHLGGCHENEKLYPSLAIEELPISNVLSTLSISPQLSFKVESFVTANCHLPLEDYFIHLLHHACEVTVQLLSESKLLEERIEGASVLLDLPGFLCVEKDCAEEESPSISARMRPQSRETDSIPSSLNEALLKPQQEQNLFANGIHDPENIDFSTFLKTIQATPLTGIIPLSLEDARNFCKNAEPLLQKAEQASLPLLMALDICSRLVFFTLGNFLPAISQALPSSLLGSSRKRGLISAVPTIAIAPFCKELLRLMKELHLALAIVKGDIPTAIRRVLQSKKGQKIYKKFIVLLSPGLSQEETSIFHEELTSLLGELKDTVFSHKDSYLSLMDEQKIAFLRARINSSVPPTITLLSTVFDDIYAYFCHLVYGVYPPREFLSIPVLLDEAPPVNDELLGLLRPSYALYPDLLRVLGKEAVDDYSGVKTHFENLSSLLLDTFDVHLENTEIRNSLLTILREKGPDSNALMVRLGALFSQNPS